MTTKTAFFIVLFVGLMYAAPASAQSRLGLVVGGSPVSGWAFNIEKPSGTSGFEVRGSALELGILRDKGSTGDWGIVFVRKQMDNSSLSAIEAYNFMPFLGGERIQLGITAGAGAGIWAGELSGTARAEATLAVRPMPSIKVKLGFGLDYPRLYGVRFGVSYLM